jgi:hypothetical protein
MARKETKLRLRAARSACNADADRVWRSGETEAAAVPALQELGSLTWICHLFPWLCRIR